MVFYRLKEEENNYGYHRWDIHEGFSLFGELVSDIKFSNKCLKHLDYEFQCNCNDESVSELVFFKVWRNIVIRNEITGDKRLGIIREKDSIKSLILEKLSEYKLSIDQKKLNNYIARVNVLKKSYNIEEIVQSRIKYYLDLYTSERKEKIFQLSQKHKIPFRLNSSELIKQYINALLPSEQSLLPTLTEIGKAEIKSIRLIYKDLSEVFQKEGLFFNLLDPETKGYVNEYLFSEKSPEKSLDQLINNQKQFESGFRIQLFRERCELYGVDHFNLKYKEEYIKYIKTFKKEEIIKKSVWSIEKLIEKEVESINLELEKKKKKTQIIKSLSDNGLPVRLKSGIVIKFIEKITDKQIPTIDQVIKSESNSIQSILNSLEPIYIKEGLEFDKSSKIIKNFIERDTGGNEIKQFNERDLKSLISTEMYYQKELKEEKLRNELKRLSIPSSKFKFLDEQHKYISTFKMEEIISKKVWSFDEIIQKETDFHQKENQLVEKLKQLNLEYRKDSTTIKDEPVYNYLFNLPNDLSLDQVIEIERNYQSNFNILNNELKKAGLKRRVHGGYSSNFTNYLFSNDNGNNNTIENIINEEFDYWKIDKSQNAIDGRKFTIIRAIKKKSIYCEDEDEEYDIIKPNDRINHFINGTTKNTEWESLSVKEHIVLQCKYTDLLAQRRYEYSYDPYSSDDGYYDYDSDSYD